MTIKGHKCTVIWGCVTTHIWQMTLIDPHALSDHLFSVVQRGTSEEITDAIRTLESWGLLDSVRNSHGDTPLISAVIAERSVEILDAVMRWPVDASNTTGNVALHYAAIRMPTVLVRLLQAGADPNRVNVQGQTPLHVAAQDGSLECVTALLEAGARCDVTNLVGRTPADSARCGGHMRVAKMIEDAAVNKRQGRDVPCRSPNTRGR